MEVLNEAFWRSLEIGPMYEAHPWAIDSLVYLVLFVGVAKVTLGKRFEGRGGNAVVIATGLALTIGASSAAYRFGFSLAELGGAAWMLLLGLLGLMVYDLARSAGLSRWPAVGLALMLALGSAAGLGPMLGEFLARSGFSAILQMALLAGLVGLAWWLASIVHLPGARLIAGGTSTLDPRVLADRVLSKEAADESVVLQQVEASVLVLLQRLLGHVRERGVDRDARRLFEEITRRERMVASLYQRVLRELARRRWLAGRQPSNLDEQLKRLLLTAQQSITRFEELLRIARAAAQASSPPLLIQALERLIAEEERSRPITTALVATLQKLKADASNPGRAGPSR